MCHYHQSAILVLTSVILVLTSVILMLTSIESCQQVLREYVDAPVKGLFIDDRGG